MFPPNTDENIQAESQAPDEADGGESGPANGESIPQRGVERGEQADAQGPDDIQKRIVANAQTDDPADRKDKSRQRRSDGEQRDQRTSVRMRGGALRQAGRRTIGGAGRGLWHLFEFGRVVALGCKIPQYALIGRIIHGLAARHDPPVAAGRMPDGNPTVIVVEIHDAIHGYDSEEPDPPYRIARLVDHGCAGRGPPLERRVERFFAAGEPVVDVAVRAQGVALDRVEAILFGEVGDFGDARTSRPCSAADRRG